MPATKLSARLEAQKQLARLIRIYVSANQTTMADCADRMKIGPATFYRRMKNPGEFTLSELSLLRTTLGIPQEEILEAIQQRL